MASTSPPGCDKAAFHDTVIIAVSGYGQEDSLKRAREAGLDDYVVKPIDQEKLTELMQRKQRRDWAPVGGQQGSS